MSIGILLLFIFTAYLVGSLCSAVIVSHLFDLPDPRTHGSNNPGATNVLRLAGKWMALGVLLADALKGALPVLIAKACHLDQMAQAWIALAAIIGHIYPVFFAFQGGKGVATALGALIGFNPLLAVSVISTWLIIATLTRYSSLASLIAVGLMPMYALRDSQLAAELPLCFITLLIWYQHKANWARLRSGRESKINLSN
jgi:glycerol-3-phosphate acyltransferase PlsY